jgi:AraC-like DNA-binding protein
MARNQMLLTLNSLASIIESFSLTTGVPIFLMDGLGNVVLTSQGFSPQAFSFADLETVQRWLETSVQTTAFNPDHYYTIFTENQFLYNLVPVVVEGSGKQALVAGPLRFRPPSDGQLVVLLRGRQIPLRQKNDIAQQISRLPEVSMARLEHLGRVLCSLCHAYFSQGVSILPDIQVLPDEITAPPIQIPKITFNLVEEDIHASFTFAQQIRQLILAGDVVGVRALRSQSKSVPLDRLIEADALRSVRYNLITGVSSIIGMIFDHNVPYEQLLMIGDKYIRLADQTKSVPEIMDLMFQSMEELARMVKRYSLQQHSRPVRQALQAIQADMRRKISLTELAELTGLSPSYLSRLIKKETGLSMVELVDQQRMEESKRLLLNTDYSILQISEMVGFSYQNHFSLRFKKYMSVTPTVFRQTGGACLDETKSHFQD